MTPAAPSFDIARTLRTVLLAMLPGIIVAIWFLGPGVLLNIVLAAWFALMFEASALWLRKLPTRSSDLIPPFEKGGSGGIFRSLINLQDTSTIITALLIALALPPFTSWWIILLACAAAILLAKHCFGGLGQNIFNPAMTGYALVLLAFPAQLAQWPALAQSLDGYTSATVLDTFKQNHAFTVADWWRTHSQFGQWGGYGWEWINLAFLGGGLFLLQQKIFSWHIPVAMLTTLGLCAAAFYDNGSSASAGSPLFHWLSGATMLGAFFVATDPATAAAKPLGRILYGALIGALVFSIRHAGHYADGVAFAVLAANAAALLFDRIDAQTLRRFFKPAGGPTDEH
jgi:Na+-translocating ferredoxin:NAD+ oxidoreductase subunit D